MVATDSYRLSVKETKLEAPLAGSFEANVPARALQELTRIVQADRGRGAERLGAHQPGDLRGRRRRALVAADRRPVPQLPPAAAGRLRARAAAGAGREITEVVRRISLLAQKNAPLRLAFAEGELTVSARTPDVGEAQESLPVPFQGEPLEIGFNPEFLRDGLEAVESGDVLLKLISPLRPGLIEAADGSGFQYLLMPIRLERVGEGRPVRVTRLSLRNFRSYEAAEVRLGPGLTVVTGPNGAGKTNLLEAIYFACTGRSCRTGERARGGALRRRRRAAGARRRARRRRPPHHGRLRARRGEAPAGRRRAPSTG